MRRIRFPKCSLQSFFSPGESHHHDAMRTTRLYRKSSKQESPLLLEGDEFHVSHDGIARSFYEIPSCHELSLEERYNLKSSEKTFIIREKQQYYESRRKMQRLAPMGRPLASFRLEEIDSAMREAGTGARTWEASIAMALYFSHNSDQLYGNMVEVGCGVGLSGILIPLGLSVRRDPGRSSLCSTTLTDGNEHVLRKCRQNIEEAYVTHGARQDIPSILVSKLDWNDPCPSIHRDKYHTVVACDCAYLYPDVERLGQMLRALLNEDDENARIHLVAPYNRAAMHEMIRYMGANLGMAVHLDWIDMNLYRLKGNRVASSPWSTLEHHERYFASNSTLKFMHATISHPMKRNYDDSNSLNDLD